MRDVVALREDRWRHHRVAVVEAGGAKALHRLNMHLTGGWVVGGVVGAGVRWRMVAFGGAGRRPPPPHTQSHSTQTMYLQPARPAAAAESVAACKRESLRIRERVRTHRAIECP